MTSTTNAVYDRTSEWEAQGTNEPTNKCRTGTETEHFQKHNIN